MRSAVVPWFLCFIPPQTCVRPAVGDWAERSLPPMTHRCSRPPLPADPRHPMKALEPIQPDPPLHPKPALPERPVGPLPPKPAIITKPPLPTPTAPAGGGGGGVRPSSAPPPSSSAERVQLRAHTHDGRTVEATAQVTAPRLMFLSALPKRGNRKVSADEFAPYIK